MGGRGVAAASNRRLRARRHRTLATPKSAGRDCPCSGPPLPVMLTKAIQESQIEWRDPEGNYRRPTKY